MKSDQISDFLSSIVVKALNFLLLNDLTVTDVGRGPKAHFRKLNDPMSKVLNHRYYFRILQ